MRIKFLLVLGLTLSTLCTANLPFIAVTDHPDAAQLQFSGTLVVLPGVFDRMTIAAKWTVPASCSLALLGSQVGGVVGAVIGAGAGLVSGPIAYLHTPNHLISSGNLIFNEKLEVTGSAPETLIKVPDDVLRKKLRHWGLGHAPRIKGTLEEISEPHLRATGILTQEQIVSNGKRMDYPCFTVTACKIVDMRTKTPYEMKDVE